MTDEEKELLDLESKVLELEVEQAKKECDEVMERISPLLPKRRTASTPTKPDSTGWSIEISHKGGHTSYRLRSAAGTVTALSEDRSKWPLEVRESVERYEAANAKVREKSRYNAMASRAGIEYR